MTPTLSASELLKALRRALQHLYDPLELRHNPLPDLLGMPPTDNRVAQVRRLLEKGIERLKPDASTPADAPARRYYDLLVFRFIEQSGQKEVATDMALSLRHFQRLESAALRALAEQLALQQNLPLSWDTVDKADGVERTDGTNWAEDDAAQVQQEIDWLKNNYPSEKIDIAGLLAPVLERLGPLLGRLALIHSLPALPPVEVQVIPMQQSLLHLLGLIAQSFQGGQLDIHAQQVESAIHLTIHAQNGASTAAPELDDGLPLAESLAHASGGELQFSWQNGAFLATLALKTIPKNRLVLVVDDNQDTLLLLERYLANSSYSFMGTRKPEKLLPLIDEHHPSILLLDVMLPGIDGWTLLSQVRQHPTGSDIPVIISTILPQENIALMLGADAFLKKPFTPHELLATLNRLA